MALEQSHDWVKARDTERLEDDAQPASEQEMEKAREIAEANPYLVDDSWTAEVISNGGMISDGGREVVVDLQKFLDARARFLAYDNVKTLEPVIAQIAASRPRDKEIDSTLH
ncbi:MAG: hypothetical protein NUV59_04305 [Patescibacteria group bacterium]|nr:hypothetical protein [Patescibacteria group bacterium]